MNEEKNEFFTEEYVNQLAKECYFARKNNDRAAVLRTESELCRAVLTPSNVINKKARSILINVKLSDSADDIITDNLIYCLKNYNYEFNDSFSAYYITYLKFRYKKHIENSKNKNGTLLPDWDNVSDNIDLAETAEENDRKRVVRKLLPSVVLGFYSHNKGKSASETRLSYFRIFASENIIESILESSSTEYFNKNEAYECTDKEFVRYISYSDYRCLDDIVDIKFKNMSQVISNVNDEEKQINVPCENRVIAEYRFVSKLDQSRTKDANVSQQRTHYKKALAVLFKDINE